MRWRVRAGVGAPRAKLWIDSAVVGILLGTKILLRNREQGCYKLGEEW